MTKILSNPEKQDILMVLDRPEATIAKIFGDGKDRKISFYADGTRLEARISIPEES